MRRVGTVDANLGQRIAFANPIGMYLRSFNSVGLTYNDNPVPDSWTRLRRGKPGFQQRLEFGPADSEPVYLDDIIVEEGASQTPLIGGYQLIKRVEVGPRVVIGPERSITPEWAVIPESLHPPACAQADVCSQRVGPAKIAYENEQQPATPRGGG